MRLLTAEFRRMQDAPTNNRKESIKRQVAVFKKRCEASVVGHLLLYLAVGVEVVYFTIEFLYPAHSYIWMLGLPLLLILGAIVCHAYEHRYAFKTIDEETDDVLGSNDSAK